MIRLPISIGTGDHMKTTIELPDAVLEEAKRAAASRGTTVRALLEAGLRRELRDQAKPTSFHLRDESFGGSGLRRELAGASWETLRALAYGERGG